MFKEKNKKKSVHLYIVCSMGVCPSAHGIIFNLYNKQKYIHINIYIYIYKHAISLL